MNVLIAASIISCVAILIVIVYSSLTLSYGEEEELSPVPVHVVHTVSIDITIISGEHDTLNLQTVPDVAYKQNQASGGVTLGQVGCFCFLVQKILVLLRERC